MELSIRGILESKQYEIQKAIISREINFGDPKDQYFPKRNEKGLTIFKKTDEEKAALATMKAKWLKTMRQKFPDFSKRNGGKKKYLQTINDGQDTEITQIS